MTAATAIKMKPSPYVDKQPSLKVVVAGHVDHGKSTLIGRLIYECEALPAAKLEEIKKATERRNVDFEWSFLLDALQSERDQNITIDSTRLWLRRPTRDLILIDVPGHVQFLRNMITGCSEADLGVLIVDAATGMEDQTRRHALLMRLLGLRHVVVVFNKMDKIDFNEQAFQKRVDEARVTLADIGLDVFTAIPVSAKQGDNLNALSSRMPWFQGPSLLSVLDTYVKDEEFRTRHMRFIVQDVLRKPEGRLYIGRVMAGTIRNNSDVLILPAGRRARVKGIYQDNLETSLEQAGAGQSIGIMLDFPLFIDRGSIIADEADAPHVANDLRANIFWLDDGTHKPGEKFTLRMKAISTPVTLRDVGSSRIHAELSEVKLQAAHPVPCETMGHASTLSSFLLQDGLNIRGIGWMDIARNEEIQPAAAKSHNITWSQSRVMAEERAAAQGHTGLTVWLTGLPASGKSTLAMEMERRLFERGWKAYVLDGDNLRYGLNADLGFDDKDRRENVRRAGEVSALFADAGVICLAAMVSPFAADRQSVRAKGGKSYYEVYIKASPETCGQRDPKKLYEKAKRGEIKGFTGVDAPYEAPENPDLVIDTESLSIEQAADLLEESILKWSRIPS
jgi:bifunctional enzyme CysN/CysC